MELQSRNTSYVSAACDACAVMITVRAAVWDTALARRER